MGPLDSPYEGGKFIVNIDFTDNYPYKAPRCKFVTKIFHPNIDIDNGAMCLGESTWVPSNKARSMIELLVHVMKNPEKHNHNSEATKLLEEDYEAYCEKARDFTQLFAK